MTAISLGRRDEASQRDAVHRALVNYTADFVASAVYVAMTLWTFSTVEERLPFLGHSFREAGFGSVVVAVIGVWLIFLLQDSVRNSASSLLGWVAVLLVLAPTVVAAMFLDNLTDRQRLLGVALPICGSVFLALSMNAAVVDLRAIRSLSFRNARVLLIAISSVLTVYVIGITPPQITGVRWSELYSFRSSFREVSSGGAIYAYAFNWQTNVVGPIILGLGLFRRSWSLFSFGVFIQLLLFTISGEKSILFSPVFALGLAFAASRDVSVNARHVVATSAALVMLSRIVVEVSGRVDAFLTISLRLLHVQGINTLYWVDFFGSNPKTRWANGLLGIFNDYPYEQPPGFVVGQSRGRASNVNVNFLGDGYGAFGVVGSIVSILIMCGYFYGLRVLSARAGVGVVLVGSSGVLFSAANSGSINMLLGGGGVLALLLLALLPEARRGA